MRADDGSSEMVILVDERNLPVGAADKETAHRLGMLHRAFSIFLLDTEGRILLQRRQPAKYHSGGLWANTCCGHPRPGETTLAAAKRRLQEELGLSARLRFAFKARYSASCSPTMLENEYVLVYFGSLTGQPKPNPAEVDRLTVLSLPEIRQMIRGYPENVTVWLKYYLEAHADDLAQAIAGQCARQGAAKPPVVQ